MTLPRTSPLAALRQALATGELTPLEVAQDAVARANASASHNSYLWFEPEYALRQAETLAARFPEPAARPALYGVPVSLKDCFDLAGTVTTAGSRFYAERNAPADRDSAMASRLKAAGAIVTGKTHLHPLAYGITGQNPDYGDSLQPRDAALLTGGSSSGAAASVQEGSAIAAIGTDTGGSIRVPAALCGLVGYRASRALAYADGPWDESPDGLWAGSVHLAPSFDTAGFLLRDPRDAAAIAEALFGLIQVADTVRPAPIRPAPIRARIGVVPDPFLRAAEPEVLQCLAGWQRRLEQQAEVSTLAEAEIAFWSASREIFGAIQASEAAATHAGHFDHFPSAIAQRLLFGAQLTADELSGYRSRLAEFRAEMAGLFARCDFLVCPCAPVSRLVAAEDQSNTRATILEYTTPFSLCGLPVVSLPGEIIGASLGTGIQLVAPAGEDAALLAFVRELGSAMAAEGDER
jgi:Asp-tRNA(Asn)/Glu-tRNA(Gln) amidotransferase A subunit family amidase